MSLFPIPNLRPVCPVDALPEPLASAVNHVIWSKDVPPAIALIDAIAAASAIVQCGYDCVAPDGELMPATINAVTTAPTACGKGRSMKQFFAPFIEARKNRRRQGGGEGEGQGQTSSQRRTVLESMIGRFSYRELMEALDGDCMNLTIQQEESLSFLMSDAFRTQFDAFTQLWSGDPPLDYYVYKRRLFASNARCGLVIRIQPDILSHFLKGAGRLTYKLGLWPRAIAACHDPIKFPLNECPRPEKIPNAGLDKYYARVIQLAGEIDNRAISGALGRVGVRLDPEATAFMLELSFRMKQWLSSNYATTREAAGRAWENTLRVAVVLHVFCVGAGSVSLDIVERAWAIIEWSLSQHHLIFVESIKPTSKQAPSAYLTQPKTPAHQRKLNADMQHALDAIGAIAHYYADGRVPVSEIQVLTGFARVRFNKALAWLVSLGMVVREPRGGQDTVRVSTSYYNANTV